MLQHGTLSPGAADLPQQTTPSALRRWFQDAGRLLPVPASFSDFARYGLAMMVVAAAASLHVWTTLQINLAETELYQLQVQRDRLQQENAELLWQVSQYTNLDEVYGRAAGLGYGPITDRKYVRPAGQEPAIFSAQPQPGTWETRLQATVDIYPWATEIQGRVQAWWNQTSNYAVEEWQRFDSWLRGQAGSQPE